MIAGHFFVIAMFPGHGPAARVYFILGRKILRVAGKDTRRPTHGYLSGFFWTDCRSHPPPEKVRTKDKLMELLNSVGSGWCGLRGLR